MNNKYLLLAIFYFTSMSAHLFCQQSIISALTGHYLETDCQKYLSEGNLQESFYKFCRTRQGKKYRCMDHFLCCKSDDYPQAHVTALKNSLGNSTFYKNIYEPALSKYYYYAVKKLVLITIIKTLETKPLTEHFEVATRLLEKHWDLLTLQTIDTKEFFNQPAIKAMEEKIKKELHAIITKAHAQDHKRQLEAHQRQEIQEKLANA